MNGHTLREIVALSLTDQLGARRIRALIRATGSATEVFRMKEQDLLQIPGIGENTARSIARFDSWKEVDRVIREGERLGAHMLGSDDPEYPPLLQQIADPPVLLWCRGNISAMSSEAVAVIGTRKPSDYGQIMTVSCVRDLCAGGLSIVSGLAYGIDTIAHHTAVQCGGVTIAVLGSGIDRIYPGANRGLALKILDSGGCVISEFAPGTKPDAGNFPVRNRIVSGLSKGVLVVETTGTGGSMITARLALEQNREVFAIPHRAGDLKGDGCNHLIQTAGAKLVRNACDMLIELSPEYMAAPITSGQTSLFVEEAAPKSPDLSTLSVRSKTIYTTLGNGRLHIDDLADRCEMPISGVLAELLTLEFSGLVKTIPGKYVERIA